MSFQKFVTSLLPVIDKRQFKGDIDDVRKMLSETLPVFDNAAKTFKGLRFRTPYLAKWDASFIKSVNSRLRGNHIELIYQIFNKCSDNLAVIERLNDKENSDIARATITYSRVQILQYVAALNFALRYARKHLIYVLSAETNVMRQSKMAGKELSKGEANWLATKYTSFVQVMRAFDHTPNELSKALESIPDIIVDEENGDAVAASTGKQALDPLGLVQVGFTFNPIYHLRMMRADWQHTEYEAMKEEKKLIEYRLMDLKNLAEGNSDPKLEQAIEHYQEIVDEYSYKLADMEKVGQ